MNLRKTTAFLCIVIPLMITGIYISYCHIKSSERSIIGADQNLLKQGKLNQYIYESFSPDYFQIVFSYTDGNFYASKNEKSIWIKYGAAGKGRSDGYIEIDDMGLPSDFCTNSIYNKNRQTLFSNIATSGESKPFCNSIPPVNFQLPTNFQADYLNQNNLIRTQYNESYLPIVIGKYYIQIHASGSIEDANKKINIVTHAFTFTPFFNQ